MIDSIEMTQFNEDVLKLFDYTVSYENGDEINKNDILEGLSKTTYKIYIKYRDDINISDLNNVYIDLNLSFTVNYVQSSVRVVRYINNWEFDYTGGEQTFTVPYNGTYKLELWGAQGGEYNSANYGGRGGYTSGEIYLDAGTTLYIYVGQAGAYSGNITTPTSWNGGGASGNNAGGKSSSGGGSTDVRLINGAWNNEQSLISRIMVAAGGGGSVNASGYTTPGGYGGGLIGGYADGTWSNNTPPTGATQTSTGTDPKNISGKTGTFGYASQTNSDGWGGGGGGGYYGGVAGHGEGGSGGSSYISGHTGCVATTSSTDKTPKSGCVTGTTDNECSIHNSKKAFTNTKMIDGEGYSWTTTRSDQELMPTPSGSTYASKQGHTGNGYAKITFLSK